MRRMGAERRHARKARIRKLSGVAAAALTALAAPVVHAAQAAPTAVSENSVIDYPAAYFASASPTTAMDMVNRLPGFAFDDGAQARGFASSAGNVLIDGQRPASKSDDLANILVRIPASRVERIQVIRGGAPGVDMQGKSVLANVILRAGSGLQGDLVADDRLIADGRNIPEGRIEGAWRGGGRTVEAALVSNSWPDDFQGSGPHRVLAPSGAVTDVSRMRNGGANRMNSASAAFETPLMGGRFRTNFLISDNRYGLSQHDDFQVAGQELEHNIQDTTQGELGVHFTRDPGHGLGFELIGLQQLNRMSLDSAFDETGEHDRFKLGDTGGESIGRGIVRWAPSDRLAVEGGGELDYNWLRTSTRFSTNGAPVSLPAANVLVTEKRGEAFLTSTWRATPKLTAEAGIRFEASEIASSGDVTLSNRFTFPKPRVLVTWSPDSLDQFRFRVEREVGQLDFNNFVAQASLNSSGGAVHTGNPDLSPQEDVAIEAAWERRFWKTGALVLTARHMQLRDVIDRRADSSGLFDTPANIGAGTEDDVQVSFTVPLDRLFIRNGMLRGQSIWRFSKVTDPTTGALRPISGQHAFDGELHFVQDLPEHKALWGIDLTPPWTERYFRFNEVDTTRKASWWVLYGEWKPTARWTFHVEWDDFTNRPVRFQREVYAGPRSSEPLQFFDDQKHRFVQELMFQVRRNFGG